MVGTGQVVPIASGSVARAGMGTVDSASAGSSSITGPLAAVGTTKDVPGGTRGRPTCGRDLQDKDAKSP